MGAFSRALVAVATLLLSGCSGEISPQDRVREYIDRVAAAAQDREWRSFEDFVADEYRDKLGLDKQQAVMVAVRYILAHQHIFILKRLDSIEIQDPRHARARVYAAMAGQPIADVQGLAGIDADIYRFDLELHLAEDGVVKAARVDWEPVDAQGFLTGP